MSVRRGDEDFETERRQSLIDEDRADHADDSDLCEHVDTRIEEEAGTGRRFWVCEDCGASSPA